MSQHVDRTGIVLSGGGAYGAFAVGVLKVLYAGRSPATQYEPVDANIFSGTSVGAFNASCMTMFSELTGEEAVRRLERIWMEEVAQRAGSCVNGVFRVRANPVNYFDPRCLRNPAEVARNIVDDSVSLGQYLFGRTANFLASRQSLAERVTATVNVSELIDASPFHRLLRDIIQEEEIRNSRRKLSLIATNWTTGVEKRFTNSDFKDGLGALAVMASTAMPGVFPPIRVGDDVYVDGGIVDNTPLNAVVKDGAVEIHIIYLDPEPRLIPLLAEANSLDTFLRVYYQMLASKISEDIETARWVNQGLGALAKYRETGSATLDDSEKFARVAGQILNAQGHRFKPLTIHRYYPSRVLGDDFGMLDFRLDAIVELIEQGQDEAITHDCIKNKCVIPERAHA